MKCPQGFNRSCWLVLGLMTFFLFAGGATIFAEDRSDPQRDNVESNDWWPMLHHDPLSSGYVNSTIPESPDILWAVPYVEGNTYEPVVLDGKVYAVHLRGLSCFDAITGDEIWHFTTEGHAYDSPAVADGLVYFCTGGYWWHAVMYCLDGDTGEEVWSITHSGFLSNDVHDSLISGDHLLYIYHNWDDAGSEEDHVSKMILRNKNTGELIWNKQLYEYHDPQPLFHDPVEHPTVVSGKDIFVVVREELRKYDARNGDLLWELDGITESPIIHGDRIIGLNTYSSGEFVHCIDSDDGQIIWTIEAPVSGLPAVHDGRVFIGIDDGRFLCLDIETGEEIWSRLLSSVWYSGVTVGIDRALVVARNSTTYEYQLLCLDTDDGEIIWSLTLDGYVRRRPAVVADGRIYISTTEYSALCIGEAPTTVSGSLNCSPISGTLPFQTNMSLTLHNSYLNQSRRGAVAIDVTLGDGSHFTNWRSGYTNLQPGQSRVLLWQTTIPNYPPMVGDNRFEMFTEDVTPAPYNQPPYPPAGDTCTDLAVVTGISP